MHGANTSCFPGPQPFGQSSVTWVRAATEQGIARGLAREETGCSSPSVRCKTTSSGAIIARGFPERCLLGGVGCSRSGTSPPCRDSPQSWLLSHPARSRWIFQFSSLDGAGDSTAPGWSLPCPMALHPDSSSAPHPLPTSFIDPCIPGTPIYRYLPDRSHTFICTSCIQCPRLQPLHCPRCWENPWDRVPGEVGFSIPRTD